MKDEKEERNNEKELEKNTGSSWYGNGADDHFSDSGDGFCGGRYAESADFCK